jgi:hypothetical protein
MRRNVRLSCLTGLLILGLFTLFGFASCGSNPVYVCPDGSQQSTPCPTPIPNTNSTPPTSLPQPTSTTTTNPTPQSNNGSSPVPEPRPQSASEIASKIGGDPNDWHPYDPNGWIYRGGPETNSFIVPHWCRVDTPQGKRYPGDEVTPQVSLTIYYNVSSYDLDGHSP